MGRQVGTANGGLPGLIVRRTRINLLRLVRLRAAADLPMAKWPVYNDRIHGGSQDLEVVQVELPKRSLWPRPQPG